jgi:hypothetical protein
MTIINYASSIINKLKALHTDDARVVIYNHHVFIVQATGVLIYHTLKFTCKAEKETISNIKYFEDSQIFKKYFNTICLESTSKNNVKLN